MPGAISPNFQEGFRSEYLAQFVFSSWGTAVPTHEQDYGLDLLCSLVERDGQRSWARSPYTVQVKSTMEPWVFDGEKSVQWLIQHPAPIFLCVVGKTTGQIRVYHTSQRFYVWGRGQLPPRIALVPTDEQQGFRPEWPANGEEFSLGAPILDFSISEFLLPTFVAEAKNTIQKWILIDEDNLALCHNGIRKFVVPNEYAPNRPPDTRVTASFTRLKALATDEEFAQALPAFRESLDNIGIELLKRGDVRGAALSVLLHRHVFPGKLFPFMNEIDDEVAVAPNQYQHVGIEHLESLIDNAIAQAQQAKKQGS